MKPKRRHRIKSEFFVYGLRDPHTQEIRYVGLTTVGMYRPQQHFYNSVLNKQHMNLSKIQWIRDLKSKNLKYEIVVLERFDSEIGLREAEARWIRIGWSAKTIFNKAYGGALLSVETRAKISAKLTGRKLSKEHVEKLTALKRGVPLSSTLKAKISAANKKSEAVARNIVRLTAMKIGVSCSSETAAKIAAAHRGKKASLITREKMIASQTGRRHPPETIKKLKLVWEIRRNKYPPLGYKKSVA